MSRPLHPDVALGIHLSTICSRNRYTRDPEPVIAELLEVAGDRGDVLAYEVGRWAGYYDDEHTAVLVTRVRAADDTVSTLKAEAVSFGAWA